MGLFGNRSPAGVYAEDRFERGLDSYRARARPLFALVFGPFVIAGLVGLILDHHVLAWSAGMLFGFGAAAWMVLRDSPPAYIENWRTGAEGERKTAKALGHLDRSRWLAVHDVDAGRGNYDHILVGPAGVFLLETKNLQGTVHVRDGKPYLRRRHDPEADKPCPSIVRDALARAAALHDELKPRSGRWVWTSAVVVVWSQFEEGIHESDRCAIVHGSRLSGWLEDHPSQLDGDTVEQLTAVVSELAGSTG